MYYCKYMDEGKDLTLEELMSQALNGDTKSYEEVLRKTVTFIKPFLYKRLNQPQEVDDVLQEVLISIHKAKHTYDPTLPYLPWVYSIAKFRVVDRLRKYYKDPLRNAGDLIEIDNMPDPNVTESMLSYEYIKGEINKLPAKQAKILSLMHEKGFTSKETAKKVNMTESAVKVSAFRAYKVLKQRLKKDE